MSDSLRAVLYVLIAGSLVGAMGFAIADNFARATFFLCNAIFMELVAQHD